MKKKTIWISSVAAGAVLLLGGTGVAVAVSDVSPSPSPSSSSTAPSTESNETEQKLTGTELDQASAAALAKVGSGKVTSAEKEHAEGPEDNVDPNEPAGSSDVAGTVYDVQVTLDNGQTVEVYLDKSFAVLQVGAPEAAEGLEGAEGPEGVEGPESAEQDSGPASGATQPAK